MDVQEARVRALRHRAGISAPAPPDPQSDVVSINEAAVELDASSARPCCIRSNAASAGRSGHKCRRKRATESRFSANRLDCLRNEEAQEGSALDQLGQRRCRGRRLQCAEDVDELGARAHAGINWS
jgi:hypothetical protein